MRKAYAFRVIREHRFHAMTLDRTGRANTKSRSTFMLDLRRASFISARTAVSEWLLVGSKGASYEESVVVRFRRRTSTNTGAPSDGTCRTTEQLDRPLRPTAASDTGSGPGRRGGYPFPGPERPHHRQGRLRYLRGERWWPRHRDSSGCGEDHARGHRGRPVRRHKQRVQ